MQGNPASTRESVGLPLRPFLYTLDQIATLIGSRPQDVRRSFIFFDGKMPGKPPRNRMIARNIAEVNDPPEWRVAEAEFIRWLRFKGFRFYERGHGVS